MDSSAMTGIDGRPASPESAALHLLVLIPVYNDWDAVGQLLRKMDVVLARHGLHPEVLLVDDASTSPVPPALVGGGYQAIQSVAVLNLRRNLGHQRAIAIGLAYVDAHTPCQAVLVMDGDGEDAPEDIPRLTKELQTTGGTRIIFAERTRRSEGWLFRLGYHCYRTLHFILTGVRVRVGNFSALPRPLLRRLTCVSELWNHYAAAVFKARIPHTSIPTRRAPRLRGRSKMDVVSLIVHGLSALSVYSEVIGVRMLIATGILAVMATSLLAVVVTIRLTTDLAIPGWASVLGGLILLLLLQLFTASLPFVFLILHGRGHPGFLPGRDYVHFVDRLVPVWSDKSHQEMKGQTVPDARPEAPR
jgi:glycosyltransferase involved in cell wall biosynthesis